MATIGTRAFWFCKERMVRAVSMPEAGHVHVHQHKVVSPADQGGQRLLAIASVVHPVSFLSQDMDHDLPSQLFIFGDQHAQVAWLSAFGPRTAGSRRCPFARIGVAIGLKDGAIGRETLIRACWLDLFPDNRLRQWIATRNRLC
jgi:hypothetical protein